MAGLGAAAKWLTGNHPMCAVFCFCGAVHVSIKLCLLNLAHNQMFEGAAFFSEIYFVYFTNALDSMRDLLLSLSLSLDLCLFLHWVIKNQQSWRYMLRM